MKNPWAKIAKNKLNRIVSTHSKLHSINMLYSGGGAEFLINSILQLFNSYNYINCIQN